MNFEGGREEGSGWSLKKEGKGEKSVGGEDQEGKRQRVQKMWILGSKKLNLLYRWDLKDTESYFIFS